MGLNVEQLIQGLEDYNVSLEKHLGQLLVDYNVLQGYFNQLSNEYEGRAAEQFKLSWSRTAEWFEQYINESQRLSKFLEQRVEALKEQGNT